MAASGRLGVITRARGSNSRRKASIASDASSRSPEEATITGSSTMFFAPLRSSACATVSTIGVCDNIPIFTAATSRSANTASICAATNADGTSWMALTPCVFCAVSAVMALAP